MEDSGKWPLPGIELILLAWVAGVALQIQGSSLMPLNIAALLCAASIGAIFTIRWIHRKALQTWASLLVVALLTGLAGFAFTEMRSSIYALQRLSPELEGKDILVTATVVNLPHANDTGLRFRLQVDSASIAGQEVKLPALLDINWYNARTASIGEITGSNTNVGKVMAGDRWRLTLRLKAPHGNRNPRGSDHELWLWEQGVGATAYVREGRRVQESPLLLEHTWAAPVSRVRQQIRESIFATVGNPRLSGLLAALAVGDQGAIERSDWNVFRSTGVAHLVAISGMHITMLAWLASLLAGFIWRRNALWCMSLPAPWAATIGGAIAAILYSLIAGWGIPAQRTCIMLLTFGLLRISGLRWPWFSVWLLACALVVAWDPWALMQAGFWLSFVAVGILFAMGDEGRAEKSGVATGVLKRLQKAAKVQISISLALAPLTLLLFSQVSLVGLIANAVAIPVVTLLLTPLDLLGLMLNPLWLAAAQVADWLMTYLQWLSEWRWASIGMATPPASLSAIATAGALLLLAGGSWSLRLLGVPWIIALFLVPAARPLEGEFDLLGIDIGQGNSVLVRTQNHSLLFDAGPTYGLEGDAGERVVVPLLQSMGEQPDMLVLSHRDTDHIGGANSILQMNPGIQVLSSIEDSHWLQRRHQIDRCLAGQNWVWDGVRFEMMHPLEADYAMRKSSNAMSCVLRISSTRQSALLVGDLEMEQEAELLDRSPQLKAQVLLVEHHGSKSSSSEAFIDAVSPRWAWVQAGYRNRYGHPAEIVKERFAMREIPLIDTVHCGAMKWESAAPQEVHCTRKDEAHYWSHQLP